ncbi:hypothetical protein GCM10007913_35430 [Devosia yakushimensis]|uniref:Uncharacterized protein n=1 Tax=Devosia yakushimensis TaxID=470028 RepID=A0ABQ5UI02_9HYPH|nr:hypothetical protein [Devosia yakushimensis]GLQ11611.1 hypothetical protein GCM10007913_35430 [Devosia yakushimensis]
MKRFLIGTSLAGMLLAATPALADGKVYVQLPDLSDFSGQEAEEFLHQLVLANVVSSNCAGFEVSEAEWSLLTDSADIVGKGILGLDSAKFDDEYYGPAFAALDEAGTCEVEGPQVEPVLEFLVDQGGSRDPLPDQEAAYIEWRALQDYWDAGGKGMPDEAAPAGKSKTK